MGYNYGIGIARQALQYLASDNDIENRVRKGWSEITVINRTSPDLDTTKENGLQINEFDKEYTSLAKPADNRELEKLAEKLVGICVDIIESNAKGKSK